jgi:hypothetical protein
MMDGFKLTTPVALMIFNRPRHTEQVFARIREARPARLLIVADGARGNRPGEAEKCAAARALTEQVDWDCEVSRNYAPDNLGCKRRVSSGLDWVFGQCEEAIILEDDCLPRHSFFRYCAELLEHYRDDKQVTAVSGDNFQFGKRWTDASYYFSRYPHVWGWATWQRAWQHYDVEMKGWPEARDSRWLNQLFDDQQRVRYWTETFQSVYDGEIDTWDHQWTFACWRMNGLTALPEINLISNIGFGLDATHTLRGSRFSAMQTEEIDFPLLHPATVVRQIEADAHTERQNFKTGWLARARRTVRRLLPN